MFLLALLGAGTCLARDGRVEARIRGQSHHQAGQAIAAGAGVADRDDASVRQRFGRRTQLDVGTATVQHQPLLDFQVAPRGRRAIDAGDRTLFGCEPDPSDSTPGPILAAGVPRVGVNGLPDTSSGGDGLVELPGFTSPMGTLYAPPRIALQADGKIVAAATLDVADQPGNVFDRYVTRLNAESYANRQSRTEGRRALRLPHAVRRKNGRPTLHELEHETRRTPGAAPWASAMISSRPAECRVGGKGRIVYFADGCVNDADLSLMWTMTIT